VGADNGPETIYYATYTSGTGALTGLTRGCCGTTGVAHANGAKVQCGMSSIFLQEISTGSSITDWAASGETWTYASTTTHSNTNTTYSGTFTITGDKTSKYSAGMRIRFVQTSTKYAIITKVSYSSPNTTVTIFLGTDYSLANAAITSPYYSTVKAPFGFPLDPSKWVVSISSTSDRAGSLTPLTWTQAETIALPLGVWNVSWSCLLGIKNSGGFPDKLGAGFGPTTAVAPADADFGSRASCYGSAVTPYTRQNLSVIPKTLTLAAAASYYLNFTILASGGITTSLFSCYGSEQPTIIRAECVYL